MTLKIDVRSRGTERYQVELQGRLDSLTAADAEKRLKPLMNSNTRELVFNIAELDYISSMGLRLIMQARKAIEKRGTVAIVNAQPQIAHVLEIAAALPQEQIFASVEEADRYFDLMQKRVLGEEE